MGLVTRDHVSSPVYDVETQSVVDSHPGLQTSSWIQDYFLLLEHRPTDLPYIFFSLDVGHLSIDIARVK
jgi:hypothetical protein